MRLDNFGRGLSRLRDACALDEYSELELAGLVHTFGFTFNLASNVLKDRLYFEGVATNTPRKAIKAAFSSGMISAEDGEVMLQALLDRNILEHVYNEEQALEAVSRIKFTYLPVFEKIYTALDAERIE